LRGVAPAPLAQRIDDRLQAHPHLGRRVVDARRRELGAIAMMLAPESGWVTGQRIEATGGYAL